MITIARLSNVQEAQTLKLLLASREIEAFIPDEMSAGTAGFLFMTKPGVRLQVAEADAEEARRIIAEHRQQGVSADDS